MSYKSIEIFTENLKGKSVRFKESVSASSSKNPGSVHVPAGAIGIVWVVRVPKMFIAMNQDLKTPLTRIPVNPPEVIEVYQDTHSRRLEFDV